MKQRSLVTGTLWLAGAGFFTRRLGFFYRIQLSQRIGSIQGKAEILTKTLTATLGEDVYILTCTLTCIRDIAKEQTFEVLP